MFSDIYRCFFKRMVDIYISALLLLLLSPILFTVIILLLCFNNAGIFFIQSRPGKNNVIFKIIKFKTMLDEKDINGNILPDAKRLTKIGIIIRKTSLDEIPQLINVIKGDMSIIGPRPLLPEYLPLYNDVQKRRHDVKPGITGWAQVNGRNTISWEQKFEYDIWYIDNLSFKLDMQILWLTMIKVFKSDGITSGAHATTEKFKGS